MAASKANHRFVEQKIGAGAFGSTCADPANELSAG
jgi:hypothetical protein